MSEYLSRLRRDQLQKFAQYLISELPQQVRKVVLVIISVLYLNFLILMTNDRGRLNFYRSLWSSLRSSMKREVRSGVLSVGSFSRTVAGNRAYNCGKLRLSEVTTNINLQFSDLQYM